MRSLGEVMVVASLEGAVLDKHGRMPRANAEVIRLFCARGGRFTVASDRTPAYVSAVVKDIPLTEPVICSGGATLFDVAESVCIAQKNLDGRAAVPVLESVQTTFPQIGIILQREDGILCAVRTSAPVHAYLRRENQVCLYSPIENVKQPWVRALLLGRPEQMDRVEQFAERYRNNSEVQFTRLADDCFQLAAAGVSKGKALQVLSQWSEVPQPDLYSIGGSHSDQQLLQMTGHSVAMPGSPVRVKLAAELVTRLDTQEGGTAEFLYQLIKDYE